MLMEYLPSANPVSSECSFPHTMSPRPPISSSLGHSLSHGNTARANANTNAIRKYKLQVICLFNTAFTKGGQTPSHGYEPLHANDAHSERRWPLTRAYPCALGRCTQKIRFDTTRTPPVAYFVLKKSDLKQVETVSVREGMYVYYEFRYRACKTRMHMEVFVEEVGEGLYRGVINPRG